MLLFCILCVVLGEDAVGEILFIKRSVNPRDRWSGHVALPGGRQEESEPLKRTASRETLEEVGLDLESEEYKYVGALDDRYTMPINIRPFLISAHGSWPSPQPFPFPYDLFYRLTALFSPCWLY